MDSEKHSVYMESRNIINIFGVTDVLSFDDLMVSCDTVEGILIIKGTNLHINHLNLDNGELNIQGDIDSFFYEDNSVQTDSGLLKRIFR